MSRLKIDFEVSISYDIAQRCVGPAIDHWVANVQNPTSGFTKALILGSALNSIRTGSGYAGALGVAFAKGQGVKHPTLTTCKVQIPAGGATYGGEMVVTTEPAGDHTRIVIDGRTQGLFGGTLRNNVHGLKDYLLGLLPECGRKAAQESGTELVGTSVAAEIERLSDLHTKGILTDTEFADAKKKILS